MKTSNSTKLGLARSRSPPSQRNGEPVSRSGMIKEHLSPTNPKEKPTAKVIKDSNSNVIGVTVQTNNVKDKLSPRITLNNNKAIENITSPGKILQKSASKQDQLDIKFHKRLVSGVPPKSKLFDSNEDAVANGDSLKDKKKKKNSKITPKLTIISVQDGDGTPSSLFKNHPNTQRTPQSNLTKKLKLELPTNTGRLSVNSMPTPLNQKKTARLEEPENLQPIIDLGDIPETKINLESRNGSCSPKIDEQMCNKKKKLSLVIPTVQISDYQTTVKPSVSTTRANFYSVQEPQKDYSPKAKGHTSSRISKNIPNLSIDNKDPDQLNLFPSKNSEFCFQMRYFKPIEESALNHFIQNVNDSKKLRSDLESDSNSTKLSLNERPKKGTPRPRMNSLTPALKASPSLTSLNSVDKLSSEKDTLIRKSNTPSTFKTHSSKQRASETKLKSSGDKDGQIKRNTSPVESKVRMRSPNQKWDQGIPKSPPRTNYKINRGPMHSIDSKDTTNNVRSSFSRLYPNLAEEMESLPVKVNDNRSRSRKKKNGNEEESKFSNLDRLLAQLRSNSKTKISLPETEDSEKGLFNPSVEPGDEIMNVDTSVNRSLARTFMKINPNNP